MKLRLETTREVTNRSATALQEDVGMTRRGLIVLIVLNMAFARSTVAQTVVESGSGASVVVMGDGLLTASFGDASIKVGYASVVSTRFLRFGAEAKLKANDGGFSSLIDGKNTRVQGEARLFAGWLTSKPHWIASAQWVTLQVGYTRASYSLVSPSGLPAGRFDTLYSALALTFHYNALLEVPKGGADAQTLLLGLSLGEGKRNNYSELTPVQVCQVVDSAPAPPTRVDRCRAARLGAYGAKRATTVASDLIWYPTFLKSRLAIDGLLRFDEARTGSRLSSGLGLFATKKGSPTVILGGLFVEARKGHAPDYGMQIGIPF